MASDRLIELSPNIKKIVQFWNRLPKSRRSASKSYFAVLSGLEDPLTTIKVAFLVTYQALYNNT